MRLARKITIAIGAAILVIMATHAYFLVQRQIVLFDADLARSVNLKRALRASIAQVWQAYGDGEAQQLVEHTISAALEGAHVRWTWLDAPPGDPPHLDLPAEQLAQLRDGERVIVFRKDDGDTMERYTYVPESLPGKRPAVLEFVESIQEQHTFIEASRMQIAVTTAGILLACTIAVYWLGIWYVSQPIQRLRDRLRAVAGGDFDSHVTLCQKNEIGDLGCEIDAMCLGLDKARQDLIADT